MKNLVKILTALATIAGAVYIVATYGEQIVAWAKKVWNMLPKCPCCEEVVDAETAEEEAPVEAEAAEEAAAEEVPVEEAAAEEAPEVIVAETDSVAAEEDFAE
jgi:hypothetical protein